MKKTLDVSQIANELEGASVFFERARQQRSQPPQSTPPQPEESENRPNTATPQDKPAASLQPERPPVSAPAREPVKASTRSPERRFIARFSYELFTDQAETLKRFSLEDQMEGKKGSMSEMVREAIDAYIEKRKHSR